MRLPAWIRRDLSPVGFLILDDLDHSTLSLETGNEVAGRTGVVTLSADSRSRILT